MKASLAGAIFALLGLMVPLLEQGAAAAAPSDIADLVARMSPQALASVGAVERALGVFMSKASETESFSVWTAPTGPIGGVATKGLEYRMPRRGGPATAGPLLVIDIDPKRCLPLANIQTAVPDLTWGGAPSLHATDPDVYWTQSNIGNTLSFGFQASGDGCLRSLVYALGDPPR